MKWSAFHCTYARLLPVVLPRSFPFRNLCVCVCLNWHECLFLWVLACTLFVYVLLSFKCCVAWTFPGSMNTANFFLILSYYFVSFGTSVCVCVTHNQCQMVGKIEGLRRNFILWFYWSQCDWAQMWCFMWIASFVYYLHLKTFVSFSFNVPSSTSMKLKQNNRLSNVRHA